MNASPWVAVGKLDQIPRRSARVVETVLGPIAIFRTADDALFALDDRCPHQGGPLSQGLVHGHRVTCPLHDQEVCLKSGRIVDGVATTGCHAVRVGNDGRVHLAVSTWRPGELEKAPSA